MALKGSGLPAPPPAPDLAAVPPTECAAGGGCGNAARSAQHTGSPLSLTSAGCCCRRQQHHRWGRLLRALRGPAWLARGLRAVQRSCLPPHPPQFTSSLKFQQAGAKLSSSSGAIAASATPCGGAGSSAGCWPWVPAVVGAGCTRLPNPGAARLLHSIPALFMLCCADWLGLTVLPCEEAVLPWLPACLLRVLIDTLTLRAGRFHPPASGAPAECLHLASPPPFSSLPAHSTPPPCPPAPFPAASRRHPLPV